MKTYIFKSGIIAAVIFAAMSCQKHSDSVDGQESVIRVTADIPSDVARKAPGDASQIDILHYEVWNEDYSSVVAEGTEPVAEHAVAFELTLIRNKTYNLILWAQNSTTDAYSWDNLKEIYVSYKDDGKTAAEGNLETRDAFYAVSQLKTHNLIDKYITLHRPFSQLNFYADDLADADFTGYTIEVKGLADVFDTVRGEGRAAADASFTFESAYLFSTEMTTVDGVEYSHVAMNYILLPGKSETFIDINAAFTANEDGNTVSKIHEMKYVAVKMNERINIYGSLLTE